MIVIFNKRRSAYEVRKYMLAKSSRGGCGAHAQGLLGALLAAMRSSAYADPARG